MILFVLLYSFVEIMNVFYTARFGIRAIENQPITYIKVRFWLRAIKYSCAVIVSFTLLAKGALILGVIILLLPYIVEKLLYLFCRRRAVKKLVKLLCNKNGKHDENEEPMSYEDAKRIAPDMVEDEIKYRGMLF